MLFGLAKSLKRQFGAHVTADTEAQWVKGVLPVGAEFVVENVVDLEKLLPDCGYKLRSVEIEARGRMKRIDCDECDSGETIVLDVTGGGTRLELAGIDEPAEGEVHVFGTVTAPFDGHIRMQVESVTKGGVAPSPVTSPVASPIASAAAPQGE